MQYRFGHTPCLHRDDARALGVSARGFALVQRPAPIHDVELEPSDKDPPPAEHVAALVLAAARVQLIVDGLAEADRRGVADHGPQGVEEFRRASRVPFRDLLRRQRVRVLREYRAIVRHVRSPFARVPIATRRLRPWEGNFNTRPSVDQAPSPQGSLAPHPRRTNVIRLVVDNVYRSAPETA